ncbi:MAG: ABC transporter substrate-binding protein [Chloroflexi bacterium]|nr:ABC transporter substrate-binding protein [Chloroflexota bacterium]
MNRSTFVEPTGRSSRITRRTGTGLAAAAPLVLLAACGPQADTKPKLPKEKQRVEWWGPANPAVDAVVAAANASDRQLDVQMTPQSVGITDASRAKFTAAVAAGTPPDLVYVDRYLARSFGALKMIGPLDASIKRSKSWKAEDFWPHLIKDVSWKGSIWGTPFTTDVRAFYWNKALFMDAGLDPDRPPATWDAVEAAADRILKRQADGSLERVGFVPTWGNPPTFYAFFLYLWQAGGEFLSADENKPAFNSPEGLRALEWMVKQVTKVGGLKAVQPLTTGFQAGPGRDVFTIGRLGMQYHTSSIKAVYDQNVPDVKIGVGPLPLPSGGRPMNYAGGFALSIPAAARQPDAAWRLSEFLVTKDTQLLWVRGVSTIPVLKAVATSAEYQQGDAARKVFVDELVRGAKWVPTIPGTVDVLNAFGKEFTAAISGEKAPRDALNAAAAQVQVVLDRNKQYR